MQISKDNAVSLSYVTQGYKYIIKQTLMNSVVNKNQRVNSMHPTGREEWENNEKIGVE